MFKKKILLTLRPWSPSSETLGRIVSCDLLFLIIYIFWFAVRFRFQLVISYSPVAHAHSSPLTPISHSVSHPHAILHPHPHPTPISHPIPHLTPSLTASLTSPLTPSLTPIPHPHLLPHSSSPSLTSPLTPISHPHLSPYSSPHSVKNMLVKGGLFQFCEEASLE